MLEETHPRNRVRGLWGQTPQSPGIEIEGIGSVPQLLTRRDRACRAVF
jgi:hypothetical protein